MGLEGNQIATFAPVRLALLTCWVNFSWKKQEQTKTEALGKLSSTKSSVEFTKRIQPPRQWTLQLLMRWPHGKRSTFSDQEILGVLKSPCPSAPQDGDPSSIQSQSFILCALDPIPFSYSTTMLQQFFPPFLTSSELSPLYWVIPISQQTCHYFFYL